MRISYEELHVSADIEKGKGRVGPETKNRQENLQYMDRHMSQALIRFTPDFSDWYRNTNFNLIVLNILFSSLVLLSTF